ncbi:hypothetical protein [Beijerinckia sp. L45]|uniref:hypothetical protein n=1 Tax=Beijerinckia sp. L45 TaxID=1641855 RepID=UPI00131B3030|nr:hypothetical protein [Beijerinckia sp. L45]
MLNSMLYGLHGMSLARHVWTMWQAKRHLFAIPARAEQEGWDALLETPVELGLTDQCQDISGGRRSQEAGAKRGLRSTPRLAAEDLLVHRLRRLRRALAMLMLCMFNALQCLDNRQAGSRICPFSAHALK